MLKILKGLVQMYAICNTTYIKELQNLRNDSYETPQPFNTDPNQACPVYQTTLE